MSLLFSLARPFIHALDAENAHNTAIKALRCGLIAPQPTLVSNMLRQKLWGLDFANPVGMAAGFDKNAEIIAPLIQQGFGFVEVGTCTPRSQEGNPKPRIFRLKEYEAVINRLGFNNKGADAFVSNLKAYTETGIVGANIGKNKDSDDAIKDYTAMLDAVYAHASYITVNISSPNTQGLRDLQAQDALSALLNALLSKRASLEGTAKPILLKIAPDLDDEGLASVADVVKSHAIDGVIVSNTTLARPEYLGSEYKAMQGGLSGKPLMAISTEKLRRFFQLTEGTIPLIGVGGIASSEDAYTKIKAGASLVQLYSALIYQGFGLVRKINAGLEKYLARDGYSHISEAIGVEA